MQYRDLIYRIHARQSMFTRSISDECVEQIVQHGEVIEDYPHAFPFPAKLLLLLVQRALYSCGSRRRQR